MTINAVGIWVNYLSGGVCRESDRREGLNIPVNMAFAFHSDAGTTLNDSIIGTLGIYHTTPTMRSSPTEHHAI